MSHVTCTPTSSWLWVRDSLSHTSHTRSSRAKQYYTSKRSHVTHINESCHTLWIRVRDYEFVTMSSWLPLSHIFHGIRMLKSETVLLIKKESCHTYNWVMSHAVNMSSWLWVCDYELWLPLSHISHGIRMLKSETEDSIVTALQTLQVGCSMCCRASCSVGCSACRSMCCSVAIYVRFVLQIVLQLSRPCGCFKCSVCCSMCYSACCSVCCSVCSSCVAVVTAL